MSGQLIQNTILHTFEKFCPFNVGHLKTMSASLIITLGIIAALIWSAWKGMPLPLPFRNRACQGAGWRRAFPNVPKQNIREYLALFAESFAFKDSTKLQFNPNDKILDIYRSLYPHKWQPDALEVETLATLIEETYRVSFSAVWSDQLTLGELFAHASGLGREQCPTQHSTRTPQKRGAG